MHVNFPLRERDLDAVGAERLFNSEANVTGYQLAHERLLNPEVNRELEGRVAKVVEQDSGLISPYDFTFRIRGFEQNGFHTLNICSISHTRVH